MNNEMFSGFDEIKANIELIKRTKDMIFLSSPKKNNRISKRRLTISIIPVTALVVFLAFMLSNVPAGNQYVLTANAQDLMQGIKPRNIAVTNTLTDQFTKSTLDFSTNLLKKTYKNGENLLISPTSAALALGMAANGANSDTLKEFINVLGRYGMTLDDLNKAYAAYSTNLLEKRGSTTLVLSNSIWFRTNLKIKQSFLQNNADYFGTDARAIDFDNKNTVNLINSWVKERTNGNIERIVNRLEPKDVMLLVNALYFKAKWEKPFDTERPASESRFYLSDGDAVQTKFMHLNEKINYIETSNSSAVLLPYDDNRLAFLCILPNPGIKTDDYIKSMSANTIPDLVNQKTNAFAEISLPQFKVTADYELNDMLKKMGLNQAFGIRADFSKILESNNKLWISSVRQKSYLQVDELGTQAGAGTSDYIVTESAISGMKYINFNRPFIYAIIDIRTNLPLFLGVLDNPSQS